MLRQRLDDNLPPRPRGAVSNPNGIAVGIGSVNHHMVNIKECNRCAAEVGELPFRPKPAGRRHRQQNIAAGLALRPEPSKIL